MASFLYDAVTETACTLKLRALTAQSMNTTTRFLGLLTCLALFVSGCSGMFKGKGASDKAVAEFHKLYNGGKISEILAAADSKFKNAASEKEFSDFMGAVQRKLGKVTNTSSAGFNVRTFNLTTTAVLQQNTTFEQGNGNETFTFEMNGEKALLVGYNISSKELIMK